VVPFTITFTRVEEIKAFLMPLSDQNIQQNRYAIIPRTLCFLLRNDELLLLRIAPGRGAWSGLLNGIGGHIQRGEDPMSSAKREIFEETGLKPSDLRLCGVATIDTQDEIGIGLFIFVGSNPTGDIRSSEEGEPLWVPIKSIHQYDLVEDLPIIIPRALDSYQTGRPFSASYHYDDAGNLKINLHP
jgi:8-oxo-dGTP diphosphatase